MFYFIRFSSNNFHRMIETNEIVIFNSDSRIFSNNVFPWREIKIKMVSCRESNMRPVKEMRSFLRQVVVVGKQKWGVEREPRSRETQRRGAVWCWDAPTEDRWQGRRWCHMKTRKGRWKGEASSRYPALALTDPLYHLSPTTFSQPPQTLSTLMHKLCIECERDLVRIG